MSRSFFRKFGINSYYEKNQLNLKKVLTNGKKSGIIGAATHFGAAAHLT